MSLKTRTLTIRLGPALREQLERAAEKDDMSLGEFVRYVLTDYLRHLPEETRDVDA